MGTSYLAPSNAPSTAASEFSPLPQSFYIALSSTALWSYINDCLILRCLGRFVNVPCMPAEKPLEEQTAEELRATIIRLKAAHAKDTEEFQSKIRDFEQRLKRDPNPRRGPK